MNIIMILEFELMSFFSFLEAQSSVNYGKSSGLLLLITDGPTSVNYGWSYFHMDSPTDKNPADSGLLRLITDGPTDKSSGLLPSIWMVLRINPPDSG